MNVAHTRSMNAPVLAFDRSSVRTFDADGRLHVARTPISKANVCPYMGSEIPGWQGLGLRPDKIYNLYRDPAELEKAAGTFNNLPLLRRHIQVSADAPMKDDVVGSIGSDVSFEAPYLMASLCVWDSEAIGGIEAEAIDELSSAYRYDADMTPGATADGEAYDGRMTNIRGNHLALVEVGRAGPDVVVADGNPFVSPFTQQPPTTQETPAMKKTKLGRALLAALSAASPKIAQDSALPGLVGGAVKSQFNAKDVSAKLMAMDEDMNPEKIDEIIDAVLGVEENPEPTQPPMTGDEDDNGAPSKHAEIIDYLRSAGVDASVLEGVGNMLTRMDKPQGQDEDMGNYMSEEDVTTAMDSMRSDLLKQFKDLESAKSAVRGVVGDVIGMDSAEEVYRFALGHMNIGHKDMPAAGLPRLFAVAQDRPKAAPSRIAMDSASLDVQIPGLSRFS